MATGLDLSKQIGPLPLGAWMAVVAGGLGIAWYTRRQSQETPVEVDDTSGVPGVGVGPGWQYVPPTSEGEKDTGKVTTNEEWAVRAINILTGMGYSAPLVDSMVRKAITGTQMSASEYALYAQALVIVGPMPSPLPPAPGPENPPVPPGDQPPATKYIGPAYRKFWKLTDKANPLQKSWETILLYYYSDVAPPGAQRTVQINWLKKYNADRKVKVDPWVPGSRAYIPRLIFLGREPGN